MNEEIKRFYFPYTEWECFNAGMYDTRLKFLDEQQVIQECVDMLSCPNYLQESMLFVTHHWVKSAHQHLSNTARNRQAYLGQTASCWAHGAPEFITKRAWNELTPEQQRAANDVADYVIADWEEKMKTGYWKRVKNIS
jgi:hypothetical protein